MRFDINLASRRYVDARRLYTNWLMLLVPLALLAAVLTGYAVAAVLGSRKIARDVRNVEAQIAKLDAARSRADEVMNRPENQDTRDQSRFLNAVIERKAFSWTQVFEELEHIVPPRVHVLSIRPDIKDSRVQLVIVAAGDSRESGQELLRHMETSDSFRDPQLKSEDVKPTPTGGSEVQFEVATTYVPRPAPAASPAAGTSAPQGGK
ncbi:MAG TPA: PilN domain-containing protein [Terriglobales bacterium]|nr:PilN domain-containing protein [Terriglobales bacterium]